MSNLILCAACQRHVRDHEVECPFCHAGIAPEAREAATRPLPSAGMPRAKLYAVGAAVAAGVAAVACGGDDTTGTTAEGGASGTAQAGGASGTAQAGGASGTAQAGGASGTAQAGGAAGAVADSGATGGQGGTADANTGLPDGPIAHPYGCVFPDPSRTTKV
jgi:hypothetical protein